MNLRDFRDDETGEEADGGERCPDCGELLENCECDIEGDGPEAA